ncbi:MAG: helix-turn-helix transcriptional regulator [bacterium]|nr:helix-turn-helix transcriptional regulator [bacterium]
MTTNGAITPLFDGRREELLRRDLLHLDVARKILLEEGYHGVTMARVAKMTGFSRGALYQRFGSKEGLIAELGIQAQMQCGSLMRRAAELPGRPRERMVAVDTAFHLYAQLYSDSLRILSIIRTEPVLEGVPSETRDQLGQLSTGLFGIVQEIVDDAVRVGDLDPPNGTSPLTLTLTLWTLALGIAVVIPGVPPLESVGITDPMAELAPGTAPILDGYGWRPLSSEWDYEETRRRVRAHIADFDPMVCEGASGSAT